MKKILYVSTIACLFLSTALIYAQGGIPYIYEKISNSEYYTYEKEPLEGMMEFSETVFPPFGKYMVEIFLRNNSHKYIDLSEARYKAVGKDGYVHFLNFEEVEANTGESGSLTLNPEDIIITYCSSPVRNDDITDIYIEVNGNEAIHFVPYGRLGQYVASPEQHLKSLLSGLMDIFKFRMPK